MLTIGKSRQAVSRSSRDYGVNISLTVLPTIIIRKSIDIFGDFGTRRAVEWISLYRICQERPV